MADQNYNTAGWDIGGAHVKVAFVQNHALIVHQWLCPLWKGIDQLASLLEEKMTLIPVQITHHHVTMTGELVDSFKNRVQGVKAIVDTFTQHAGDVDTSYYSTQGYLDTCEAASRPDAIASANWLASAHAVARHMDNAIFIDMGSTTTDVIKIVDKQLCLHGMTDFDRLKSAELIYTGVVRSCVNTITHHVVYRDDRVPLVAENFATMADVYRILGLLPDHADLGDTMDHQPKDELSSLRRLARMVGADYQEQDHDDWLAVANYLSLRQKQHIINKIKNINADHPGIRTIVAAGIGRFLVRQIAGDLNFQYQDFADCVVPEEVQTHSTASDCAPAISLVFS